MEAWDAAFSAVGVTVGQVLLTQHDTSHRETYLNARNTLERLLELGVVPIVNENDTVAVDEIRFGDNDGLAALVATTVNAQLVVLLTDIEGLYDADPRLSDEAQLLSEVDELTDDLFGAAGGAGSEVGSGGMRTKLEAARMLMKAGIPLVICNGSREGVVSAAAAGEPVGTVFKPGDTSISAKKLWIALAHKPSGQIVIDDGAVSALLSAGKSLLPAGVVSVSGAFGAGDAVVLTDRSGNAVGRGLVGLSADVLERVKGMKTSEIAEVLPEAAGVEVVHRDHLAIL
jgi:glutamate 5-kinase